VIVYVETNFLIGIAKGQDSQAEELLQNIPSSVRLVMPSICFVEAMTTLEQEQKYNQDFVHRLDIQVNEAGRVQTSQNAKLLVKSLKQSKLDFLERNNEIEQSFYTAFSQLLSKVAIITLSTDILQKCLSSNILEKHILDRFVLECIIHHARLHDEERKVFISHNSKEFGRREVT
jgi:hypothetical protein